MDLTFPGPCPDVSEIMAANERSGGYFFSRDTMRFFRSRVLDGVYGGRLFVTSEQPPHGPRTYTVRAILDSGDVRTVARDYPTARKAKAAAAAMVPAPDAPVTPGDFVASYDGWGSLVIHTSDRFVWYVRACGVDAAREAYRTTRPAQANRVSRVKFHALFPQPVFARVSS